MRFSPYEIIASLLRFDSAIRFVNELTSYIY